MKKLFVLFLVCLMSLTIQAQEEHLKFMGIPLTGSITAFQSKLQAKGIKYDKTTSMQLGAGCRAFNGTFSGEKAHIYVYYNDKTKNVYRAKAVITYLDKSIGENKFQEFRLMLKTKYSDQVATDSGRVRGLSRDITLASLPTDAKTADDAWYTLDGRRLIGRPTQRGVYVNNHKKVVIKVGSN